MARTIIPTASNVLTLVNDEVIRQRKVSAPAVIHFPSLRQRAWLIVKEIKVMPVGNLFPDGTVKE